MSPVNVSLLPLSETKARQNELSGALPLLRRYTPGAGSLLETVFFGPPELDPPGSAPQTIHLARIAGPSAFTNHIPYGE